MSGCRIQVMGRLCHSEITFTCKRPTYVKKNSKERRKVYEIVQEIPYVQDRRIVENKKI